MEITQLTQLTYEHRGVTFRITPEAVYDIQEQHGVDIVRMVSLSIDRILASMGLATGGFRVAVSVGMEPTAEGWLNTIKVNRILDV